MLERFGHGGDLLTAQEAFGGSAADFVDFSSNMNPLGPPQAVLSVIQDYGRVITAYPDPASRRLTAKIARLHGVQEESVLVGNGAAELIDLIIRVKRPRAAAVPAPSFTEYSDAVHKVGGQVWDVPLLEEEEFAFNERAAASVEGRPSLWIFGSPNNPTGRRVEPSIIRQLLDDGHTVVLDEAFMDFMPDGEAASLIQEAEGHERLTVLRSMTKFYAVPGIRLGYAIAHPDTIKEMRHLQVPWSVNSLAQAIGEAALEDSRFAEETLEWLTIERPYLSEQLGRLGLRVYPGEANYILFSLPPESGLTAGDLQRALGRRGVLIRDASLFAGLSPFHCRVAVKLRGDNDRLLAELRACLTTGTDEGGGAVEAK
ncbi:threonine-phosphate decarboxylase CobD [Paenibacillus tarimensis]|uniref:threonine-phosphate decarboxylase CobD n=1 Tax=Paenibacillus tarimensis TaxID=416012 RepID=UPI001F01C9DF|nr:threonine-phosphate decarboxylase CobD [Paenibacillus tarimensis]MCF2944796.1 threonine-phosphate decarboxylase CobD [Paenibacillus tarimensis]